jgi:hypothetical protein
MQTDWNWLSNSTCAFWKHASWTLAYNARVHSGTVHAGTGGYRRRMYMYILELFMLERGEMKFGIGRMVECELYNQWNGHDWNACDVALQVRRSPSEKSAADSSVHPSAPPATRSHPPRAPTPRRPIFFQLFSCD